MELLRSRERATVDSMRSQAGSRGIKSGVVIGPDGAYNYDMLAKVDSGGVNERKRTKRDAVSVEVAGEERVKAQVDGGELFVKEKGGDTEVWAIEYFTIGVGGYLPQDEDNVQVFVLRKEDMIGCKNVRESVLNDVMKSRIGRALIFDVGVKEGGCKDHDFVRIASKLKVDAVVLYGDRGPKAEEDVLDVVPMDAEEVELDIELERNLDQDFRDLLREDLKASVLVMSFSGAKALISMEGGGVRFSSDKMVVVSWNDIRRVLSPAAWPQDERQRGRLERKMRSVHGEERWPERNQVIRWARENAEKVWREKARGGEGGPRGGGGGGGGGGGRGGGRGGHTEL